MQHFETETSPPQWPFPHLASGLRSLCRCLNPLLLSLAPLDVHAERNEMGQKPVHPFTSPAGCPVWHEEAVACAAATTTAQSTAHMPPLINTTYRSASFWSLVPRYPTRPAPTHTPHRTLQPPSATGARTGAKDRPEGPTAGDVHLTSHQRCEAQWWTPSPFPHARPHAPSIPCFQGGDVPPPSILTHTLPTPTLF